MKVTFGTKTSYKCFPLENEYINNKTLFELYVSSKKNLGYFFADSEGEIEIECRNNTIKAENFEKYSNEYLNCYNYSLIGVENENSCFQNDIPVKDGSKCCYLESYQINPDGNIKEDKRCYPIPNEYLTKNKTLKNYLMEATNLETLDYICNTNITIIADDIIEGQKARIIINASPSDIGGFARIVINNKTYKVYLNHGSATYEVRNLNDGDYLVAVYYEGTDNYYNSSAITHFTVYRNITSKEDTFLSIFADNIIVGENQTVEILVGPGEVYGYGVLTINNNSFDFYVVNGSANVTLTDLALGDYVISASYNESYYYHASSNITSFSVVKKYNDSNFKMDVNLSLVRNGLGEVSVDFKPYTISGNLTEAPTIWSYIIQEMKILHTSFIMRLFP